MALLNRIHNSCTPLLVGTWECTEWISVISPQYRPKEGYNNYLYWCTVIGYILSLVWRGDNHHQSLDELRGDWSAAGGQCESDIVSSEVIGQVVTC